MVMFYNALLNYIHVSLSFGMCLPENISGSHGFLRTRWPGGPFRNRVTYATFSQNSEVVSK